MDILRKVLVPAIFSGLLLNSLAYAEEANGESHCGNNKTLFFCNTGNGKKIEVCDAKKTIRYSFGKPQKKPELEINVLRDKVSSYQWAGFSQTEYYSIDIPSGNTVYRVFWSADRGGEDENLAAGVEVVIDEKLVATVYCKAEGLVNNILGVDLKPS